nr:zinc ribbon domain-containing protein [Actinomycetota bacterium]
MRCPSCDHEIADDKAVFCPRCGARVGPDQFEATDSIDADESDGHTTELRPEDRGPSVVPSVDTDVVQIGGRSTGAEGPAPSDDEARSSAPEPAASEADPPASTSEEPARRGSSSVSSRLEGPRDRAATAMAGARRGLASGGWLDASQAAGLAFLGLLGIGAVLLLAAKLQLPDLGNSFNPINVLSAIVMAGLGTLGVPLHLGGIEVSVIPLGALAAAGLVISWAVRTSLRRRESVGTRDRLLDGAKVAIPFGLLCWLAALIFRLREGPNPVSSGAGEALVFGLLWGALFGLLGALRSESKLRHVFSGGLDRFRGRAATAYEGFVAGGIMLLVTFLLCAFALLLWIIVGLARGGTPKGFGVGDAVAAIVYLIAFLPNMLATVAGFSVGAPVEVGGQITVAGRLRGGVPSYSVFDWDGGTPPVYVALLIMIPVIACSIGGYLAYRNAKDKKQVVEVLGAAVVTFSVTLLILATLAEARLGAGLLGRSGFARLAVDAPIAFLLSVVWAGALGFAGWKVAEMQDDGSPPAEKKTARDSDG